MPPIDLILLMKTPKLSKVANPHPPRSWIFAERTLDFSKKI
jgi:hypothetical protein